MKKILICFIFIFSLFCNKSFSVIETTPEFVFLQNIQDMKADFTQKQFDGKNITRTYGSILIKKPNSILLDHDGKDVKLRILSVNGNVKMIDKDIGQTTYVDNQYSELMQFFTNNLKAEKLQLSTRNELCLEFQQIGEQLEACLKIDLEKQTVKYIDVFAIIEEQEKKNAVEKLKKAKKYQIMNIVFRNVDINKGINDSEFIIKDNRIFGADD